MSEDYIYIKNVGLIKIPPRNTKKDILEMYEKLDTGEFIELLDNNITKINNLYVYT